MTAEIKEIRETALRRGERPSSLRLYKAVRAVLRRPAIASFPIVAVNNEVLDLPGATIVAPVHRSQIDPAVIAFFSQRRLRALGKESLFTVPVFGYICAALGAIPVRRGEAASDAMKAAKMLLDEGETMIVFPEGTRQSGPKVGELFDGVAWLSSRSQARVIPIGIAGTDEAMPSGAKRIHRTPIALVVADPMDPPQPSNGKRVSRDDMAAFTEVLRAKMQTAQDQAEQLRNDLLAERS